MYPPTHFIVALFLGELLVETGYLSHHHAILIAFLAIAIDLDHYIHYVIKHRDLSWKHFWNDSNTGKDMDGRRWIHHWQGFLLVTVGVVALFFFNIAVAFMIGIAYYSHMFLDYSELNRAHIRRWFHKDVFGFKFKIPEYELILESVLLLAILLLVVI